MAKSNTDIREQIRGSLDALGRTADTALTGFTDGCSGLRRILADVGVTETPILDWFHIAMRLQHLKQKWRLWNGKAKDAQISIDRINAVMHHFRGETDGRKTIAPAKKLCIALQALS